MKDLRVRQHKVTAAGACGSQHRLSLWCNHWSWTKAKFTFHSYHTDLNLVWAQAHLSTSVAFQTLCISEQSNPPPSSQPLTLSLKFLLQGEKRVSQIMNLNTDLQNIFFSLWSLTSSHMILKQPTRIKFLRRAQQLHTPEASLRFLAAQFAGRELSWKRNYRS